MRTAALIAFAGVLTALAFKPFAWMPVGALALGAWLGQFYDRRLCLPAYFLIGFAWATYAATAALAARLPLALEGEVVAIGGRVAEFSTRTGHSRRIVLAQVRGRAPFAAPGVLPERLIVDWFASDSDLAPGAWCELYVRLSAARGLANPGGRDREREYLARHLPARAQVIHHPGNVCTDIAAPHMPSALRATVSRAIQSAVANSDSAAVLRALTVDDRSGLSETQWAVMRDTGTSHLISISGLHISIVALGAFAICRVIAAIIGVRHQAYPAIRVAWYGALCAALAYAALAGFGTPVARATVMVAAAALAGLCLRPVLSWDTWLVALVLLVALDPLCLLSSGTWLSFAAVAVLIAIAQRSRTGLTALCRTHVVLALAMAPLTAYLFGQVSMSAPLANLIAVPLTSLLVVPLALAASMVLPLHAGLSGILWDMSARLWEALWFFLSYLAEVTPAYRLPATFDLATTVCSTLGMILLVAPAALRLRVLGVLLCLTVLVPRSLPLAAGEFRLHLLDVGQGLAVLVQTRHSAMLYDTGPRWHLAESDAGSAVVVPALRALGVRQLDTLVVSHADLDHAGGLRSVLAALPTRIVLFSEPLQDLAAPEVRPCAAPYRWTSDDVEFEILHPPDAARGSRNSRSCVLSIRGRYGSALLPGDIEADAEALLSRHAAAGLAADVLVVPHHGSKTSSTPAFIAAVRPRLALIPVGYRNRYGFPHATVLARYHAARTRVLTTAQSGAVSVQFTRRGLHTSIWRTQGLGFWRQELTAP